MVWVSITTIPSRIAHLHGALNRWDLSGVDGILIHVPPVQLRTGAPYPTDDAWLEHLKPEVRALVHVHRCERDWGPLTKWVGVLAFDALPDATMIVIADDDTVYPVSYLERMGALAAMAEDATAGPVAIAGAAPMADFWRIGFLFPKPRAVVPMLAGLEPGDVCEGFSGVAVRLGTLRVPAFAAITTALASMDAATWMSDDLVVNVALAELGVSRWALVPRPQLPQLALAEALSAWNNFHKYARAGALLSHALHAAGDATYTANAHVAAEAPPWLAKPALERVILAGAGSNAIVPA